MECCATRKPRPGDKLASARSGHARRRAHSASHGDPLVEIVNHRDAPRQLRAYHLPVCADCTTDSDDGDETFSTPPSSPSRRPIVAPEPEPVQVQPACAPLWGGDVAHLPIPYRPPPVQAQRGTASAWPDMMRGDRLYRCYFAAAFACLDRNLRGETSADGSAWSSSKVTSTDGLDISVCNSSPARGCSDPRIYRGECIFPYDIDDINGAFEPGVRLEWDKGLAMYERIKDIDDSVGVVRCQTPKTGPVSPRDFLDYQWKLQGRFPGGLRYYYTMGFSIPEKDNSWDPCPDGYVRGRNYCGCGMLFEELASQEDGSPRAKITSCIHSDIGGGMPRWVIHAAMGNAYKDMFRRLIAHLRS